MRECTIHVATLWCDVIYVMLRVLYILSVEITDDVI